MSRLNVDQISSRSGTSVPEIEIPLLHVYLSTNQDVTDATPGCYFQAHLIRKL